MKILPKMYTFLWINNSTGQVNTSWIIARTPSNAVGATSRMIGIRMKGWQYTYIEKAYLPSLLAMLLPKYSYTPKGSWSDWRKVK